MPNVVNLHFDVSKQAITRTDSELVASGAINTLVANFNFCQTWEGLYKFCRFEGAGGVIDVRIVDNKCVIPWEVIEAPSFTMACYGTRSTDVQLTTAKLYVKVYQSINFIAEEPLPPTPQLVDIYEHLAQNDISDLARQTQVNSEASTRAAADNALGARINSEASTRAAADNALGARIDNLVTAGHNAQSGNATVTVSSGDNYGYKRVTFPEEFEHNPSVVVQVTGATNGSWWANVTDTAANSFEIYVFTESLVPNGASVHVKWTAWDSNGSDTPAEVIDARTNANGVVKGSLKARLDGDFTALSGEIAALDATLSGEVAEIQSELQSGLAEIATYYPKLISGAYISASSGSLSTSANGWHSNFIEIDNYDHVTFIGSDMGTSAALVAFYDSAKEYLKEISTIGTDKAGSLKYDYDVETLVNAGAKYVAFSAYGSNGLSSFGAYLFKTNNIKYKLESLDVKKANASKVYNRSVDLVDSGYVDYPRYTLDPTNNAKNTGYVEIDRNYRYLSFATKISSSGCAIAFYDEAKSVIPALCIAGGDGVVSRNIDVSDAAYDNAKYFVVSYYGGSVQDYSEFACKMYDEGTIESRIAAVEYGNTEAPKKILIFGDSISDSAHVGITNGVTTSYYFRNPSSSYTDSHGNTVNYYMWPWFVNSLLGCEDVRCYAESGATYKDFAEHTGADARRNVSYQVSLAIADKNNAGGAFSVDDFEPDVIIFALGTNDAQPNDTPESAFAKIVYSSENVIDVNGTLNNLDRSKFCESVMWSYLKIRQAFPYALGLSVLPIQRAANDTNFGNLNDYMATIARRYGFIPVDGISECGIIREGNASGSLGTTLKDGLHPNEKGQNMMARMIIAAIKRYYYPMDGMN